MQEGHIISHVYAAHSDLAELIIYISLNTTYRCNIQFYSNVIFVFDSQGNMHPSFPYESGRSRGGDYGSGVGGVRGRGDVLVQSHPGLEDSLVLHNALSSVVEEAQVSDRSHFFRYFYYYCFLPYIVSYI